MWPCSLEPHGIQLHTGHVAFFIGISWNTATYWACDLVHWNLLEYSYILGMWPCSLNLLEYSYILGMWPCSLESLGIQLHTGHVALFIGISWNTATYWACGLVHWNLLEYSYILGMWPCSLEPLGIQLHTGHVTLFIGISWNTATYWACGLVHWNLFEYRPLSRRHHCNRE